MGLVICSNCGKEIDVNETVCPYCGKSQETTSNSQPSIENHSPYCAECGKPVPSNASFCPQCGFPLNKKNEELFPPIIGENNLPAKKESAKRIVIGLVLFLLASVFLIIAVTRITNDIYRAYLRHYQDVEELYNDTLSSSGRSYIYDSILYDCKDMMKRDNAAIWKYRGEAIAFASVGVVLGCIGIFTIKKDKNKNH